MPLGSDGGHGSFNIQNDIDSFFSLDTKIAVEHPDWTKEQRYQESAVRFNTIMFPQQVRSYLEEKRGSKEMSVKAVWEVVDGKLINAEYGAFDKMINNAQTKEERESLRLYQETMVNAPAGTRLLSFDLHANADGRHAVRYADLSYKDDSGKIHVEKRFDIAGENSALTLNESFVGLYTVGNEDHGKTFVTDGNSQVGVLVIAPSETVAVEELIKDISAVRDLSENNRDSTFAVKNPEDYLPKAYEADLADAPNYELPTREIELPFFINNQTDDLSIMSNQVHKVIGSVAADFSDAGNRMFWETAATLSATRAFIKKQLEKKPAGEGEKEKPLSIKKPTVNSELRPLEILVETARFEKGKISGMQTDSLAEQSPFSEGVRQVKDAVSNMLSTKIKLASDKDFLPFHAPREKTNSWKNREERKVRSETRPVKRHDQKFGKLNIENQLIRLRQNETQSKNKEKRVAKLRKQLLLVLQRVQKAERAGRRAYLPTKSKKIEFNFAKLRSQKDIKFQNRKQEKLMNRLVKKETRNEKPVKYKKMARELGVALVIWRFLIDFGKNGRLKVNLFHEVKPENRKLVPVEPDKDNDKSVSKILESQEPRPWILLSIIWYLNMLREGGKGNNQIKKTAKKHKKLQVSSPELNFPPQGIIFSAFS